jgi:hypothetical protein
MREVDVSEHGVRRRWRTVKGALPEDLTVLTRHYPKRFLGQTLEEERECSLRAAGSRPHPGCPPASLSP